MTLPEDAASHAKVLAESYGVPLDTMTRLISEGGTYVYHEEGGILTRGLFALGSRAVHVAPTVVLTGALLLIIASGYWSIRGRRMLKPRRLFSAS